MAEGSDPESKTEEATPRKLEEARKKGDVAKSPDVAAAMSLAGAVGVLLIGGGYFSQQMAEDMLPFLAEPHAMIGGLQAGAGLEIGIIALEPQRFADPQSGDGKQAENAVVGPAMQALCRANR